MAIIARNGKVLMGLRAYKKATVWTFPGGRRDFGEEPEKNLKREVEEEIGITDLEIVRKLGKKEGVAEGPEGKDQVFVYECTTKQEPKNMEPQKFVEWQWFDPNNLPENIIDPQDKKFLKKI